MIRQGDAWSSDAFMFFFAVHIGNYQQLELDFEIRLPYQGFRI